MRPDRRPAVSAGRYMRPFSLNTLAIASPILAGLFTTSTPTASSAAILSEALPFPPATIAPA